MFENDFIRLNIHSLTKHERLKQKINDFGYVNIINSSKYLFASRCVNNKNLYEHKISEIDIIKLYEFQMKNTKSLTHLISKVEYMFRKIVSEFYYEVEDTILIEDIRSLHKSKYNNSAELDTLLDRILKQQTKKKISKNIVINNLTFGQLVIFIQENIKLWHFFSQYFMRRNSHISNETIMIKKILNNLKDEHLRFGIRKIKNNVGKTITYKAKIENLADLCKELVLLRNSLLHQKPLFIYLQEGKIFYKTKKKENWHSKFNLVKETNNLNLTRSFLLLLIDKYSLNKNIKWTSILPYSIKENRELLKLEIFSKKVDNRDQILLKNLKEFDDIFQNIWKTPQNKLPQTRSKVKIYEFYSKIIQLNTISGNKLFTLKKYEILDNYAWLPKQAQENIKIVTMYEKKKMSMLDTLDTLEDDLNNLNYTFDLIKKIAKQWQYNNGLLTINI